MAVNSMDEASSSVLNWRAPVVTLKDGRHITIDQFPFEVFKRLWSQFAVVLAPLILDVIQKVGGTELLSNDGSTQKTEEELSAETTEIVAAILGLIKTRTSELIALPGFISELLSAVPELTPDELRKLRTRDALALAAAALAVLVVELSETRDFFAGVLPGVAAALSSEIASTNPTTRE